MYKVIVLFFAGMNLILGQSNLDKLEAEGFENLAEFEQESHYFLTYENNRYRYEGDALAIVLELLEHSDNLTDISILIQNRGLPMTKVHFNLQSWLNFKSGAIEIEDWIQQAEFSIDVDRIANLFEDRKKINESFKKIDAVVGLGLNYILGNFDNSVRLKVNIQPELQSVLGPGVILSGRYNIPTFNDVDNEDPYLVMSRLTQDFRFKKNTFLNVNVGYFTNARFGIYSRMDRFLDGERLRLRVDFGITRMGRLNKDFKAESNIVNKYNMTGGLIYRWNKYDTDLSFRYGTFLGTDLGYKARMTRQFNEVFVSLFLNKTNFGQMVGFDFRVPIGPKKHLKPKRIRIRTREHFDLIYNYVSDSNNIATEFFTGSNILNQFTEYYPEILRKSLIERLK